MELPESVLLDVPFFKNDGDGNQCLLVCARTAIVRHTGNDISLAQLDLESGRPANGWTFTQQMMLPLLKHGCTATYYSSTPLEPYLEGIPFFERHYGADWETIAPRVNVSSVVAATQILLTKNCFELRTCSVSFIEAALAAGHTVIANIDHNMLRGAPGKYSGHAIVLVGYTPTEFVYHQNGPTNAAPNVHVSKERFLAAWNHPATDHDIVIVSQPHPQQ